MKTLSWLVVKPSWFLRVQHRFGGMWDESKNGGGIRDENRMAGPGYALFHGQDRGIGQVQAGS